MDLMIGFKMLYNRMEDYFACSLLKDCDYVHIKTHIELKRFLNKVHPDLWTDHDTDYSLEKSGVSPVRRKVILHLINREVL